MKKKTMIRTPSNLHPPCSTCASSRTVSSSGEADRTGHQHQTCLPLRHQEPNQRKPQDRRYGTVCCQSNGTTVQVSRSKCNIYGDLYDGCSCTVYYVAYASGSYDIYSVDIYGDTTVNPYSYDIDVYDPYDYSYGYYNDDYYKNRTTIYNDDGSSQTIWPDGSMTGVTADGYRIESDPNGYFDIYDRYGNVIGGGYDEYFISNG